MSSHAIILSLLLLMSCAQSQVAIEKVPTENDTTAFANAYRTQGPTFSLYKNWLPLLGAEQIITFLETDNSNCHPEAHELGKAIYLQNQDLVQSLTLCDHACNSGCMHGVIMAALPYEPTSADVLHLAEKCGTNYREGDCLHGIGHGLYHFLQDLNASISLCDSLDGSRAYYCATGVYMQYESDEPLDRKNPLSPCDTHKYPAACFRYQLVNAVSTSAQNVTYWQNKCKELNGNARIGCYHGLGNAYLERIEGNRSTYAEVCLTGNADEELACIEGAAERMGKYTPLTAKAPCETLDGWHRDACLRAVKNKMYSFEKDFRIYLLNNS